MNGGQQVASLSKRMEKSDPCSYRSASLTLVTHEEAVFRLEEVLVLGRGMKKKP